MAIKTSKTKNMKIRKSVMQIAETLFIIGNQLKSENVTMETYQKLVLKMTRNGSEYTGKESFVLTKNLLERNRIKQTGNIKILFYNKTEFKVKIKR